MEEARAMKEAEATGDTRTVERPALFYTGASFWSLRLP